MGMQQALCAMTTNTFAVRQISPLFELLYCVRARSQKVHHNSHFFGSFRTEPWASVVLFSGAAQYSSVVPSQRGMGLLMGLLRPRPVENASS